jgi:hypothetical protein
MAWYLALQGPPNRIGQSLSYELQESANVHQIQQELSSSATIDRAVPIPVLFHNRREVTLYVRPAAWGAWAFYEMSEQERQELAAASVNALAQAAQQKQAKNKQPQRPQGPSVIPRLDR